MYLEQDRRDIDKNKLRDKEFDNVENRNRNG